LSVGVPLILGHGVYTTMWLLFDI